MPFPILTTTFIAMAFFIFGATWYRMNLNNNEPFNVETIQTSTTTTISSQIQSTTTETINFTDISDVICDCIVESLCNNTQLINDMTKYCSGEDDIEKKICCPIGFVEVVDNAPNQSGTESNYDSIVVNVMSNNNNSTDDTEIISEMEVGTGELDFEDFGGTDLPNSNSNSNSDDDVQPDYNLISTRTLLIPQQIISENQISFKTHKNFQFLPHWKECGQSLVNILSNPTGIRKTRIVGGEKVDASEFPWVVRLGYLYKNNTDEFIVYKCAGTIINQRYIISAAHCISNYGVPAEILVQSINKGNVSLKIDKIIIHPLYNKTIKGNDIMLIRLGDIIEAKNNNYDNNTNIELAPICLPFFTEYGVDLSKTLYKNAEYVLGWGVNIWNGTKLSNNLKKLLVPNISNQLCNKMYGKYFQVMESQICAGGFIGQDTCQGDSGGPLATSFDSSSLSNSGIVHVQLGITSFGAKLCGKGVPGVYTRISYYLQWILDTIEP